MPSSKRLKILSNTEIEELYGLPTFTRPEQEQYFSLDPDALKVLSKRTTIASKVHFVLQLGYFKATSQFFNVDFPAVHNDIEYILKSYFPEEKLSTKNVAKQTRHTNQNTILSLLGYSGDKPKIKQQIILMLRDKILHCSDPVYLFHEIMCYADQHKLMLLAYSTLQDLIGEAIIHEEQRLTVLLQHNLSASAWSAIENLLKSNEDGYLLSALKKDPKSFKTKQITGEIIKQKMNHDLFKAAKALLPKLELSQQNIQYYAQLAVHYPIHKLKLLSSSLRSVYILCFIYHRYHRISDNLMVSFFHYLEKYKSDGLCCKKNQSCYSVLKLTKENSDSGTNHFQRLVMPLMVWKQ